MSLLRAKVSVLYLALILAQKMRHLHRKSREVIGKLLALEVWNMKIGVSPLGRRVNQPLLYELIGLERRQLIG